MIVIVLRVLALKLFKIRERGRTGVVKSVGQAVATARLDAEFEKRSLAMFEKLPDSGGGGVSD